MTKKKPASKARKKVPNPNHYTKLRAFRLSPAEDALIVEASAASGRSLSDWIRSSLLSAAAGPGLAPRS